jgi:hypothetical protein
MILISLKCLPYGENRISDDLIVNGHTLKKSTRKLLFASDIDDNSVFAYMEELLWAAFTPLLS